MNTLVNIAGPLIGLYLLWWFITTPHPLLSSLERVILLVLLYLLIAIGERAIARYQPAVDRWWARRGAKQGHRSP